MLILRIIFIISIIILSTKNTDYILACGIFAWVGKDIKYFRRDLFNILGMYNDSRGGDACGIYYDDKYYKGIGATAKYEKLIPELDLHNVLKLKEYPVIIGHDRKTSVGANTIVNAQPIILLDNDDNIAYVHAHNGTISNYEELAKLHSVVLENNESDSIAVAKLIELVGFDILAEYEGTGAFLMYFKNEPNILYAFHGKSKVTQYGVAIEERPLAFLNIPGKGTYISSESNHLNNIANPKKEIKPVEFKHNVLYKLEGDQVIELREIDRTAVYPKTTKSTKVYSSGYNRNAEDYEYGSGYGTTVKFSSRNLVDHIGTTSSGYIRWDRGLYKIDEKGTIAHGTYFITSYGYIYSKEKALKYNESYYEVSFVHGIMMKDRRSFEMLNTFLTLKGINTFTKFYDEENFRFHDLVSKIKDCAIQPFHRHTLKGVTTSLLKPSCMKTSSLYYGNYYFDGIFRPILSRFEFRVKQGDIYSHVEDKTLLSLDDFCRDTLIMDYEFDVTTEAEKIRINNEVTKHWEELFKKASEDCKTCELYKTHPEYCNDYCVNIPSEKTDSDKAYEKAYQDYTEDNETTKEIAMTLLLSNFKDLSKPLETVISTVEDIGTNTDLDSEVLEVIETIKTLSNQLTKY